MKLKEIREQRFYLAELKTGLSKLEKSEIEYTYIESHDAIQTLSSDIHGEVIINNNGTLANIAHETVHAIQYENSLFEFKSFGDNVIKISSVLADVVEIQAYRTQFSLTGKNSLPYSINSKPRTIFDVNSSWLYGIINPSDGSFVYKPNSSK